MEFKHIPVMLSECIESLKIKPDGVYMDGTTGGGGHSSEIASRLNENGTLICFDLDSEALNVAKTRIKSRGKVIFAHTNYKNFEQVLQDNKIDKLDGILVDLGVSSYQIDNAERGFSYMQDGPLKMTMDGEQKLNAEVVVNTYSAERLMQIFREYGEERFAKAIAENIVKQRQLERITTTTRLAEIVAESVPMKFRFAGGHPAKRVFQAIRIEVNGELSGLREFLFDCVRRGLNQGGRLAVITFHSLEDRIAKEVFAELSTDCLCDKSLPVCVCHHVAEVKKISRKPILPTPSELEINPRSHSAKLRVVEKL